ncbi:hypothetical protein SH661x_004668 [Planctomicrobium sp. SH661]|uniref:hypothetical protein n=1 Tax=Planctomicrobium sp. SH661 TaxID=3448124 RepID=UPI003F5B510A
MATLSELRRRFEHSPDCKLVSPDVYLERLTGHQNWVRADEPSANLVGLKDKSTGARILVPVEELSRQSLTGIRRFS